MRQVDVDILLDAMAAGKQECRDGSAVKSAVQPASSGQVRPNHQREPSDLHSSRTANQDKVCVLIPVTSRKQVWGRLDDSFLFRMPLARLAETCEPDKFSYSIFVGYDEGDAFFDNMTTIDDLRRWMQANAPFASLEARSFANELEKPGPVMNLLSREAYADRCDFMYRINDDTEFLTPWTGAFVEALRGFTPPLRGVVGPSCVQGNSAILTHDFVHRSHLEVFPTHYPAALTDWWLDDWISSVYGERNTRKLSEVVVRHHTMDMRYAVNREAEAILGHLIEQGRLRISRLSKVKVIAYSLSGKRPRHVDGALANAKLIADFFPGWTMRVYHDRSVPEPVLEYLREHDAELVDMSNDPLKNQMVWRFLPAGEEEVDRFLSRDIDSRLSAREAAAVKEWMGSEQPFHVMRDHPSHSNFAVSAGMWGSVGGAVRHIREQMLGDRLTNDYLADMHFLNSQIWPVMSRAGVMVHDSFSCDRLQTRPFPTPRQGAEHVGSVYEDGAVRQVDVDILLDALAAGKHECADDTNWVGVRFLGGLGNQMFQTASCYGIAKARGARCCLFDFDGSKIQDAVNMIEPVEICHLGSSFQVQSEGLHDQQFVPALMASATPAVNATVGDYLQSWLYFRDSGPPFELRERAWAHRWVQERSINVGIHVQRGDMGESFQASYFEKAITNLRDIESSKLIFVVVTNDILWARAQNVFAGMTISEGHLSQQDMAILAACKHLIITVGTFGWWAAYLKTQEGSVQYYIAKWEILHWESHTSRHYYLPLWMGIQHEASDPCTICKVDPSQNSTDSRAHYQKHMYNIEEGCGEICDLDLEGRPSLFFNYIAKRFDCQALGTNAALDASGWEYPPPREIPEPMRAAFTFDGKIKVSSFYFDQRYLDSTAMEPVWSYDHVENLADKSRRRELEGNYGRDETNWIIEGLARMALEGSDVLVIGSESPWVEACVLAAGARNITTLEYGKITSQHPRIATLTPAELRARFAEYMSRFDAVVTFSSVEHSGLGRYGDALNPYGDKQAVARAWCMAKPGARLLIGVPVTKSNDRLEFNAHRIYGPIQLPHLLANWEQVWRAPGGEQVVHVLRKPSLDSV